MAIVINGSGTVTGISVGGLPDGVVDAGTLATDSVSLTEMASGTDGNIISYDASGNPVAIATGSDGQVLTSTGAGSPPAFEALPSSGITEVDMWRISSSLSLNAGTLTTVSANWERVDTDGFAKIGTGMTNSNGTWTFPSTGIWKVDFHALFNNSAVSSRYSILTIYTSTDGGTNYDEAVTIRTNLHNSGSSSYGSAAGSYIFDITNAGNTRFYQRAISSAAGNLAGNTGGNETYFTFVKLAET